MSEHAVVTGGASGIGAAVSQLTKNLAIEWAPFGMRVNNVAPGHTLTPMVQAMIDDGYDVTDTGQRIPLGRAGLPLLQPAGWHAGGEGPGVRLRGLQ